jgi:hypothetical protein
MSDTTQTSGTTEVRNKVNAASRYAGTYASGALTIFVALGTFSPDQQQQILHSAHQMYVATQEFIGAAANIWYIVFPVIAIWLGKAGVDSSGFKNMMDKIFSAAQGGSRDAALTIIKAAAAPQIGTKAIINPMLSSPNDTPPQVAASVSELPPQIKHEVTQ